jgi:hypothetical protein
MSKTEPLLLLSEAIDRLDTSASGAARDIIGQGRIAVIALRSDILGGTTPEPVEALLANAKRTDVWWATDEVTATYDGSLDRRAILGPRSDLRDESVRLAWSYASVQADWMITFRKVRVHWPALVKTLEALGFRVGKPRTKSGPKEGEQSIKNVAWEIAVQILDDDRRLQPGYGRQIKIARLVNTELRARGYEYEVDSIRKIIGRSVRDWEAAHPRK